MGSEQHRLCRKCLLKDMSEKEFFYNMYRYISNLPEDDKVSNSEYERRLKKCGECTNLLNGICRICGCFVEMRAAISVKHCPNSAPKW